MNPHFQHLPQLPWPSNGALSYRVGTLLQGWHNFIGLTHAAGEPKLGRT